VCLAALDGWARLPRAYGVEAFFTLEVVDSTDEEAPSPPSPASTTGSAFPRSGS
jgi:hypothetical protein